MITSAEKLEYIYLVEEISLDHCVVSRYDRVREVAVIGLSKDIHAFATGSAEYKGVIFLVELDMALRHVSVLVLVGCLPRQLHDDCYSVS